MSAPLARSRTAVRERPTLDLAAPYGGGFQQDPVLLSFDFSEAERPTLPSPVPQRKANPIKDAIIRWLETQL